MLPQAVAHEDLLSMGLSRQEYWSWLPCPPPGHLPNPGTEPMSPALQVDSSPAELSGKPHLIHRDHIFIVLIPYFVEVTRPSSRKSLSHMFLHIGKPGYFLLSSFLFQLILGCNSLKLQKRTFDKMNIS